MSGSAKAKAAFFSGVSMFVLMATAPRVRAGDLPDGAVKIKAPAKPPVDDGKWTWWLEGAKFGTLGQSVNFGDPVAVGLPKSGFEGAVGFDYKVPYSPWHVSASVRYGQTRSKNGVFVRRGTVNASQQTKVVTITGSPPTSHTFTNAHGIKLPVTANGIFSHKESHLVGDFAVGRDFGLGTGVAQLKFGARYAEINAKTTGSGAFTAPATLGTAGTPINRYTSGFSFEQQSRFTGMGPRIGIEGTLPIYGAWSIDYLGGGAALFANRSLIVTTTGAASTFGINNLLSNDQGVVLNLDAQAMLSYQFTANFKLSGGYRFDGYWNALRTIDANGNIVNGNRFFHGPTMRGSVSF